MLLCITLPYLLPYRSPYHIPLASWFCLSTLPHAPCHLIHATWLVTLLSTMILELSIYFSLALRLSPLPTSLFYLFLTKGTVQNKLCSYILSLSDRGGGRGRLSKVIAGKVENEQILVPLNSKKYLKKYV